MEPTQTIIPGAELMDSALTEIITLQRQIEESGNAAIEQMGAVINASVKQGALLHDKQIEFGDSFEVWFEENIVPHGLDRETAKIRIRRAKQHKQDPANILGDASAMRQALLGEGLLPAAEGKPTSEALPTAFDLSYRKRMEIEDMEMDLLQSFMLKTQPIANDREKAKARIDALRG
jgi:hypothetical protein